MRQIESGYHSGTNMGDYLEPLLNSAEKEIKIISPFISNKYAEKLRDIAKNKHVIVKVITSNCEENYHRDSLSTLHDNKIIVKKPLKTGEKFEEPNIVQIIFIALVIIPFFVVNPPLGFMLALGILFLHNNSKNFETVEIKIPIEVKIAQSKFVHSKIYIIDDKVAAIGSANLTFMGMNRNHEHLDIKQNVVEVQKIVNDFERLW